MPDEGKTFSGSSILDLRIWLRQVRTLYRSTLLLDQYITEQFLNHLKAVVTIHILSWKV